MIRLVGREADFNEEPLKSEIKDPRVQSGTG